MSFNTVSQLKDSISGQLQGLNLDNVKNLYKALERTARETCVELDIPEASLQSNLILYDGVYDYGELPSIFGSAITDVRPQGVSRSSVNYTYRKPPQDFDREKGFGTTGTEIAFEYKNGTPVTRIYSVLPKSRAILDAMSTTSGWSEGGSASAPVQDSIIYYSAPASLRLTMTGASTGTLTKTISSLDLSEYEDVGVVFLAVRIPDGASATDITSMTFRVGSSASNYNDVSVTEGFLGTWTVGEWLLIAFDFSTASQTGTPDWSAITYVYLSIAHGATITNLRLGGLWMSYPCPVTAFYQTNAIFMASSTPSNRITSDNDQVILNEAAYVIFEIKAARTIAKQQGGTIASSFISDIDRQLYGIPGDMNRPGLIPMYKADNPSRELREIGSWYE